MEDLKTGQKYLCANDEKINEYEHEPIPEPLKCEYCGKILYYRGIMHPFKPKTIWEWISPDNCNCEASIKYREEAEKLRKEEIKRQEGKSLKNSKSIYRKL